MNQYLESFCDIFAEAIERYRFDVSATDEDTIVLAQKTYQLKFVMWREAVEVSFCELKTDNSVLVYNLRDFIITQMKDEDRAIPENAVQPGWSEVYKRNICSLYHFSNALKNRLPSMLKGNMDWLELYEKAEWYREPKYENRCM